MSVTSARGFRAAGLSAGLKPTGAPDLALVVNDGPQHAAAALFTANRVQAAPVLWSRQVARGGRIRAVVLNSGGANACTGPAGFQDTHATAERAAELLGISSGEVAVCSTGVIGRRLPLDLLLGGLQAASRVLDEQGGADAADAIRTTDTVAKQATARGTGFVVGGMAKGAGMLAPALATMLSVITTDAAADAGTLQAVLDAVAPVTFGRVDSDGCLSTNDTVLLLASGASGVTPDEAELQQAVHEVSASLARQMVADAEGAGKEIEVVVVGAAAEADAEEVGRSIARNNLLKCALAGNDAYWGRVLAAVGTTSAAFDPLRLSVAFNDVWVARDACATEQDGTVDISGRQLRITVDLHAGPAAATIWTNDLTEAYVHENSAYTS